MHSTEKTKQIPGKTRRAEELHLKETLSIIRSNVEFYQKEVSALRTDIDDMQAHFHDDNPELINTLENTYTMYDFQSRTLERNIRALKKPYFGRIDFYDETLGTDEAFYIGKCGVSKDATHPLVIDWRAPIANVYYDHGLGKCSYTAPEGKELPIDLKLKRTYEIADGKLLNMFDTEVIANDDLLTAYLSKNKQAVLGEIVATIQKEQNEIIRKSPYHNCLVQGVAGSGKTTVAMHRISYILYNYANRFRPEDFYIVGSNQILLNYITSVLPDLDVYGIRQMTMEQLFVRLLYEDWDDTKYCIQSFDRGKDKTPIFDKDLRNAHSSAATSTVHKGTLSWFHALEAFCTRLEAESISTDSIYLNRRQFVEGIVNGKAGVHDLREGNVKIYESDEAKINAEPRVLLMDSTSVERYIRDNPTVSIQSKINMLNERLRTKIKDEFLGKEIYYTEAEMKAILKSYHGWYGGRAWKGSIFHLYDIFLQEQAAGSTNAPAANSPVMDAPGSDASETNSLSSDAPGLGPESREICTSAGSTTSDSRTAFDVYDLAALAYLYKRVKETETIREASHVVIDEAQDFGMMVYAVLKFCMKDCTYTIMGDVSQNIHFEHGLNDWEVLKELYIKDAFDSFGILKKSYRNTVEISNFATKILQHGNFSIYPVEPIIRHGEQPQIVEVRGAAASAGSDSHAFGSSAASSATYSSTSSLWEKAADICREWQSKDLNTIAIICRDEAAAKQTTAELGTLISLNENPLETAEFNHGIMVLPVEYTKGLEFDAVLILNPTAEDYPADDGHAKLLYVAATRALHELCVLHTGNLSALLSEPKQKELAQIFVDSATKKSAVMVSRVKRPDQNAGIDSQKLLSSKKFTPSGPDKTTAARSFGVNNGPKAGALASQHDFSFGSMPSTEALRPMGYAKSDHTIRWVHKQADGLYMQSTYGVLRITPLASHIIRITFAAKQESLNFVHPAVKDLRAFAEWKYRDSPKLLELKTRKLYLQLDKTTGSISYMSADKRPLLAERNRESRILEKPTFGNARARLYLDWTKNENLYALGTGIRATLPLKGTAKYISHVRTPAAPNPAGSDSGMKETSLSTRIPMIVSDRGYGLIFASDSPVLSCTLPTYGTHVCIDGTEVLDYYFITGTDVEDLISCYQTLCGES